LIQILQYLEATQIHPYAYLLDNVLSLEDFLLTILVGWQQIRAWINELVWMDVRAFGSYACRFLWMWINLTSLEMIQQTYWFIFRSPTCLVNDMQHSSRHFRGTCHDDQPPLMVVNMVGLPSRITLLTFKKFPCFRAFED
jgi:hypothetical protein